jgi:hypothetical protein
MAEPFSRRQARFVPDRVIVPEGVEHDRWYDVTVGRRHDDVRPGSVLLAVGTRRLHVPASCLEFRVRPGAPARRWSRKALLAASLVPLGVIAAVAVAAVNVQSR